MNDEHTEIGASPFPGITLRCICEGHTDFINRIAWQNSGDLVASPGADQTIRIWDSRDGTPVMNITGHENVVRSVAWTGDGKALISGSWDGALGFCTLQEGILHKIDVARDLNAVALSPDNSICAIAAESPYVIILSDRAIIATLKKAQKIRNANLGGGLSAFGQTASIWRTDVLSHINNLQWSHDGRRLAAASADGTIFVWRRSSRLIHKLVGHLDSVFSVTWSADCSTLISGSWDSTIRVWDAKSGRCIRVIEAHTSALSSVSISADGRILASKAVDSTVRLWRTDTWQQICLLPEFSSRHSSPSLAFHPSQPVLATMGQDDTILRIWDLDISTLLAATTKATSSTQHVSAKVVLVGESNIGKSCLAMRLAEDRYPQDFEHGTTHGMRVWAANAKEFTALDPAIVSDPQREIILWDMGGQDEYQLVHQLFLHDTSLAMVLIDPTRGRVALDEARAWSLRLHKQLADRGAIKLLVGAKQDTHNPTVNVAAIDELCREHGFVGYYETSAKTNEGIVELREAIGRALDWNTLAKTSRPRAFQIIRDEIARQRVAGEVLLFVSELAQTLSKDKNISSKAIDAVSQHLAMQGALVQTKSIQGENVLVLQLPVIERYAGSLIIAARDNPRGVPALEERLLSGPDLSLPGLASEHRLKRIQERIVLECIIELMIQRGICYRHQGLLIFPTLFPEPSTDTVESLPYSVSLYYDFTGAIDNIYASLIARLMIVETFGKGRIWVQRAEFDEPDQGVCGVRQIKYKSGLAHIDVYFGEDTASDRRRLFTRFVEDHLREGGVEIREHQTIKCRCQREIAEDIVRENIARGEKDVICPWCRAHTLISESVATMGEDDPDSERTLYALRKDVLERTARDIHRTKEIMGQTADSTRRKADPIWVLHLSDLHFSRTTTVRSSLQWLLQDLKNGLGRTTVDYLVISGDFTDKGQEEGFECAREFVSLLIDELGLSAQRCIFVPGNHDTQDRGESYGWRSNVRGLEQHQYVQQGTIYLVRDDEFYQQRFRKFSDIFYHKIVAKPYPLESAKQGISHLFPDTGIQFLSLNSNWRIDQFHRRNAGVDPEAVAHLLAEADIQRERAIQRGDLAPTQPLLRLAVWHHAVTGESMMRDTTFITNLQKAGVRVCLHGDVHEMRCDLLGYRRPSSIEIIGAGSFGAPGTDRPESVPRLYNVLEIDRSLASIRVHTRQQRKPDGSWEGFYEWLHPERENVRLPYYDIVF